MTLGFDFMQKEGVLPLPVTLVKALGADLAQKHPGSNILLKSRFPFPTGRRRNPSSMRSSPPRWPRSKKTPNAVLPRRERE